MHYSNDNLKTLEKTSPIAINLIDKNGKFTFNQKTEVFEFVYLGNVQSNDKAPQHELKEIVFETEQKHLKYLDASFCELVHLVIKNCPNLQTLYLNNNQLKSIRFEGRFEKLDMLVLDRNQLTELDLQPANFPSLKYLYLHDNKLVDLSGMAGLFAGQLVDFNIEKNESLNSPPKEIAEQGKKAVKDYLTLLYKEQNLKIKPKYQFEAKLLLIGEAEVGKTSLRKKLEDAYSDLPSDRDRTYGIEITPLKFDILERFKKKLPDLSQDKLLVKCWDFGGQKIYHGTHQIFFNEETCYVFVVNKSESVLDFNYWFSTIQLYAGNEARVFVVMNQKYGFKDYFQKDEYVNFKFIHDHFNLDLWTKYDESDPLNGETNKQKNKYNIDQINELKERIIFKIHDLPFISNPLSATYVDIREELNELNKDFIYFSEFRTICTKHGLSLSEIETISKYLNRIGAITHFYENNLASDIVFLNSDWLVKTIYKVLRDDTVERKLGRIQLSDFDLIWKADQLDFEIKHLTAIMDKFGLMYQIPLTNQFIVPEQLPAGKPYKHWEYEDKNECLRFRYLFDNYMPEGMMCHLIVALHTYIVKHENVWKRGLNIEFEKNTFAEILDSKGNFNYFEIRITGKRKKELLDIIRLKFNEITIRFKKLPFEEEVPCNCTQCITLGEFPYYHKYKTIQNYQDAGKHKVRCEKLMDDVSINQILGQIENIKEKNMPQNSEDRGSKMETQSIVNNNNYFNAPVGNFGQQQEITNQTNNLQSADPQLLAKFDLLLLLVKNNPILAAKNEIESKENELKVWAASEQIPQKDCDLIPENKAHELLKTIEARLEKLDTGKDAKLEELKQFLKNEANTAAKLKFTIPFIPGFLQFEYGINAKDAKKGIKGIFNIFKKSK